jgi:hypothetical protein
MGGTVRVRCMTGTGRDLFSRQVTGEDGRILPTYKAALVAACCVDADGALMFSTDDVEALGRKSHRALSRVFDAAERINSAGPAAVERAEKN